MKGSESTDGVWEDGRITLRSIVMKVCVNRWTGLFWLRTGSGPCNDTRQVKYV